MIEAALQLNKPDFKLEVNFSVPGRGVTAVFGPSGCGKTTLLRAMTGLEPDTTGSLSVNAEQWLGANGSKAVEERRVGVVFQKTVSPDVRGFVLRPWGMPGCGHERVPSAAL